MLSTTEMEYVRSIVLAYQKQGYKYYLCHTITNNYSSDEYDICIYFSQEKIEAYNSNRFNIPTGIMINIDSTAKNNNNTDDNQIVYTFGGEVTVDKAEFVYTNSELNEVYDITEAVINPDILEDTNYSRINYLLVIFLVIFFVYIFIRDILNIGGK